MASSAEAVVPDYTYGNPARKTEGKTVIAHISDLHFTVRTNPSEESVWKALSDDLQTKRVDFLAVTGDLIDSSFRDNVMIGGVEEAFGKVYDYLKHLCGLLEIPIDTGLGVVPGNHDFRTKGVISTQSRFETIRRLKQRFVSPQFELFYNKFKTQYQPKLLPSLNCSVFTFDSNTTDYGLNFASGRITNEDINEFVSLNRRMEAEHREEWRSCHKIALVHHHPMPIAATELEAGFIEQEDFHLLKNAGLFMTEMVRHKVDLILHGHKHYPALSKATFPQMNEDDHTISVIAAGSVCHGSPHVSYNLITVHDNGEVNLERRVRDAASYGRTSWSKTLQSYEETRRARFERLARIQGASLKTEKYKRVAVIQAGSGDVTNYEEYEDVTAFSPNGEEVESIKRQYSSQSGSSRTPQLSADFRIRWEWEDEAAGIGRINFNPPIGNYPVSFAVTNETHNAIFFNKKDRLDVTGNDSEESIKARVREAHALFVLKVVYPETFVPLRLVLEALNERDQRDYVEERYAAARVTRFENDNSVVLTLEKPLPGYAYRLVWELPQNEVEELDVKPSDARYSVEVLNRLIKLQGRDTHALREVEQRLHNLKDSINYSTIPIGADDMEILIHVYDQARRGLVCVAAIDPSTPMQELLRQVIPIGHRIIGQAYKRREYVALASQGDIEIDHTDFYDYDKGHTGVLSIPLFYPFNKGLRVGVITLATKSNTASFLRLLDERLSDEDESALRAVVGLVLAWYSKQLLMALGLTST